tara:strand:- start:1221 stop:2897 length:1677 start_codon:yes stop_codon:yes gene_type:complete
MLSHFNKKIVLFFCLNFSFISFYTLANNEVIHKKGTQITDVNPNQKTLLNCSNNDENIVFQPEPIFDETQEGIYFFHRWANWLHIKTKVKTLKNESAFFLSQCDKKKPDLEELERHLRTKKYLRDAEVSYDENDERIQVKTWDNWSLLPTASLGRQGGQNNFSWGVKERNFLGLGIYAKAEAYSDVQRSGNRIISTVPLFQKQNIDLKFIFANNDDGKQKSIFLQKDFVSFHTNYAYTFGLNDEQRVDTIFQNGDDKAKFKHDIIVKKIGFAWLKQNTENYAVHYSLGLTQDEHSFNAFNSGKNSLPSQQLPQDRALLYPWVGFEYIEKDFKKLTNIHLITQIEDFNNGWQVNTKIGLGNGNQKNAAWSILQADVSKGYFFNDTLFLIDLKFRNENYKTNNDRFYAKLKSELFYPFSNQWVFYLNNITTISSNQYLDSPISIGGDTGLRGFPLQYQQGNNSIKLTSELRYYPHISLFKLVDLAAAAFIDTGKAFGRNTVEQVENIENGWLYSAGIGARLYSPHSSKEHQIIHIDLAFPISNNPAISNVELRLQLSNSF